MAQMRDLGSGRVQPLRAHHTFGRLPDQVDSCVDLAAVSRIHAAIEWNGVAWLLRDLSRNGTWLGEEKLQTGESYPLKLGQEIRFGSPQHPAWKIEDLTPPCDLLQAQEGAQTIALDKYHFLPNDESPELALSLSAEDGQWHLEDISTGESRVLRHGDSFHCHQKHWQLFLVEHLVATEQMSFEPRHFTDYEFCFETSLDEENSRLNLSSDGEQVDLGERSHHYVLLHLARRRAEDADSGLDVNSQGWVDTELLAKELGLDAGHLNILIFRARKQLAEALPAVTGLNKLIQRMRGRLRFGGSCYSVCKGAEVTHRLTAKAE